MHMGSDHQCFPPAWLGLGVRMSSRHPLSELDQGLSEGSNRQRKKTVGSFPLKSSA